jgi:DNA-binding MarR family transcriptional regulator
VDILDQHGSMSAGELARESRLTTGAITAVIDRLERAGVARRVADPSDRRRVLVELTPETRGSIQEFMGPIGDLATKSMGHYTDQQLELLIDFTRRGRQAQQEHAEWLRERLAERERKRSAS